MEQIEQLASELRTQIDAVKGIAEEITGKAAKGEQLSESAKQTADEALTKLSELQAEQKELAQKMARRGESDKPDFKSLGEHFVGSESYASLKNAGGRGRASYELKAAITSATTSAAGSAGDLVQTTRLGGIFELPQRMLTVRDLIASGQMGGNSLEYIKETGFTNNAAMVAEGALKPQSDLKFDTVTTSAKVIAHYMKASRQILDDAPQLQSVINNRLIYGLKLKEEAQLLNGDGTGQNLLGIIPQASAYEPALTLAAATKIDRLRLSMLQAVLAQYPASGHVLNPIDWTGIELTKETSGAYILANPQGVASPTMWGLPVVQSQSITAGNFLTGAFSLGAQLFDRWASRVEVATENEDDFVKNMVTILAEERLALAVYRPEAFVYGAFA